MNSEGPAKSDCTNKRLSDIGPAFHAYSAENIKAVKLYSWKYIECQSKKFMVCVCVAGGGVWGMCKGDGFSIATGIEPTAH